MKCIMPSGDAHWPTCSFPRRHLTIQCTKVNTICRYAVAFDWFGESLFCGLLHSSLDISFGHIRDLNERPL